jgi:hypothetical protein
MKRPFFFISLTWLLLMVLPWGHIPAIQGNIYLAFLTNMLRLGLALTMFIFPGVLLYILARGKNDELVDSWGILPIGFTFSVLMIGVIGLIGRVAGLSFELVKGIFALAGVIELILLSRLKPRLDTLKGQLLDAFRSILNNPPLLLALILATSMTFNDYLFFIDDLTYLTYLTNWQHSTHLGFINIVHQTNALENVRFWLAMYPMGQALLADLSGVPGILLLGNYLELFLVPLAVITSFWFTRTLGLSRKVAGFAVLIQVSLYTWMLSEQFPVGMWFYQDMAEDKVTAAFILSPVFFTFALLFLRSPTKRNLLIVSLCGLALMITHPVILFFSCVIIFGIALFSQIVTRMGWRAFLQLMTVSFALMLPYVAIRFFDRSFQRNHPFDAAGASATYQFDKYINVTNNVFYGLNPEVLKFVDIPLGSNGYSAFQLFRFTPIVLVACAGILSIVNLKKGALYWYVLACASLVFFATLPYTGWILGFFVTARVISRASWFSPLGLSGVLVMLLFRSWLKALHIINDKGRVILVKNLRLTVELIGMGGCLVFAAPMLAINLLFHSPSFFANQNYFTQLANVGTYIDEHTDNMVTGIALDYKDTQLLPGVSAHTYLISFREETDYNGFNNSFSLDEIHERINASNTIRSLDDTVPPEERCGLMQKFNVRFVLARIDNAEPFKNVIDKCNISVKDVFESGDLVLLDITDSN